MLHDYFAGSAGQELLGLITLRIRHLGLGNVHQRRLNLCRLRHNLVEVALPVGRPRYHRFSIGLSQCGGGAHGHQVILKDLREHRAPKGDQVTRQPWCQHDRAHRTTDKRLSHRVPPQQYS